MQSNDEQMRPTKKKSKKGGIKHVIDPMMEPEQDSMKLAK